MEFYKQISFAKLSQKRNPLKFVWLPKPNIPAACWRETKMLMTQFPCWNLYELLRSLTNSNILPTTILLDVGKCWSSLVQLFRSNFLNTVVTYLQLKGKLTNSMKLRPSWEAHSLSAGQEILRFLWNKKVYCPAHKTAPLDPVHNIFKHIYVILSPTPRSPNGSSLHVVLLKVYIHFASSQLVLHVSPSSFCSIWITK
jgi:hypothetical protein